MIIIIKTFVNAIGSILSNKCSLFFFSHKELKSKTILSLKGEMYKITLDVRLKFFYVFCFDGFLVKKKYSHSIGNDPLNNSSQRLQTHWINVVFRPSLFSMGFKFNLFFLSIETDCQVPFATETVMQLCHGRRRCTISADTQTFGNPCRPDSRMYLKTVYTCGKFDFI